ncbi:heterokaryon incompatibility protein-domain-containing protein [Boletus coccyginus]|nr:heterokaryon incompatibility protein-domain-containing protein [Boletus coccyginus]
MDHNSSRDCLCLVRRKTGHVVEKCPQYTQQAEHLGSTLPPDVEPTRPSPPFNPFPTIEGSTQALCQRCSKLDALSRIASHRPFVSEDFDKNRSKRVRKKMAQIPSLGPVLSLRLLSMCPLCRLIFDMSHLDDEDVKIVHSGGELVVMTGWMIHRLEDLSWSEYERGKDPYAKCVYTAVATASSWADGILELGQLVLGAVEAIGLIDIGGNYSIIKDWLRRCNDLHHITCYPLVSEGLKQIKLIDVETRQIVMYPPDGCDYIALSYVWGGVEQPSYKLGEVLPTIPATLEDAMVVTRNLGKQYLWADSLCIEQGNGVEMTIQIALMSAIYSGAWATIISLCGQSARSGLSRAVIYNAYSLSTDLVVYFECNSVQCCESLDDSNSPFHLLSDEQRRSALDDVVQDLEKSRLSNILGPEGVVGRGVLRDPFRPISSAVEAQVDDNNFARYLRLVHSYTTKRMSHDADSLNAFSAVLTRLAENYYKGGFVHGLPVNDLPRALLWFHFSPPHRRIDFPAWSWAGWGGGVSDGGLYGVDTYSTVMPPLRRHGKKLSEMENSSQGRTNDEEDTDSWEDDDVLDSDASSGSVSSYNPDDINPEDEMNLRNDPVFRLAKTMFEETPTVLLGIEEHESLIEGIIIRLSLMETPMNHCSDSETDEYDEWCFVRPEGHPKPQRMMFYDHDAVQLAKQQSDDQREFLRVSRDTLGVTEDIYNALLLIDRDGDVANRVGVASLKLENVGLLDDFKPERRLFKLR